MPATVTGLSLPPMKTRHAPSRHCRHARVYGHTTTAMHDIEYISPIEYTPPLSINLFDVVIYMQDGPRKSALQAVLTMARCSSPFMRLARSTLHVSLVQVMSSCGRWKPDVLRPVIVGMRGSMLIQLRPYM